MRLTTLVGGNVVIFAVGMAVDGMLFILTLYAQQVLGYSAAQFGLMTAVMTVMGILGALVGQNIVTGVGVRPVAAVSLLLVSAGCALLIWVSPAGTYVQDILTGLLIFGPGMGAAFVAAQIAALTGVAERDSGLASGLVDTSFNLGAAIGIAVVSTVAITRTNTILAAGNQTEPLTALTEGFQTAFLVTAAFAILGLIATLLLPTTARSASR